MKVVFATFAVVSNAKPIFTKGVGCDTERRCCNTCPEGYKVILDVKTCAAAAEVLTPWRDYGGRSYCRYQEKVERKLINSWEDIVREVHLEDPNQETAFGCSVIRTVPNYFAGTCELQVNTYTEADVSLCGNTTVRPARATWWHTQAFCQLDGPFVPDSGDCYSACRGTSKLQHEGLKPEILACMKTCGYDKSDCTGGKLLDCTSAHRTLRIAAIDICYDACGCKSPMSNHSIQPSSCIFGGPSITTDVTVV